jgi:NADH:ubiquinone oxidoreductase subunit 6 (subunit J)
VIASVLFVLTAAMAIVGAFGAALVRNLFHASLLLGLCLLGVAGLYLFLEQQWLACVQVIVYVGGILVLILFATLFSADVMGAVQTRSRAQFVAGGIVAALAAGVAFRLAAAGRAAADGRGRTETPRADTFDGDGFTVGDLLMGDWFVPFFAAGLLLTVALVGAVVVVQRFRRPAGEVADA